MSLPNYLAKIKSAGVYRFVWDKSVVPPQQAETLRLLIGYSDKGPFNTPVYIDNVADFKTIYGKGSKRLERKGVYFHRMAEQALTSGPILALNLKPFDKKKNEEDVIVPENVDYISFNGADPSIISSKMAVSSLYDTNRFWKLDEDLLPGKISNSQYFNIVATDTKDSSCTVFIRKTVPESYAGITFRSWYATQGLEMPEYIENVADNSMNDYFAEIYVFKGKFTEELCGGVFSNYFDAKYRKAGDDETGKYVYDEETETYRLPKETETAEYVIDKYILKSDYTDVFGQPADALEALASLSNSNFVGSYSGSTLPYFKDANGNYISLDLKFNADFNSHKMLMKMNEDLLYNGVEIAKVVDFNSPIYLEGYTYTEPSGNYYESCITMLQQKGIRTALTNRVDVEYHYIIDTFDTLPTQNKSELFVLAKEKDNAFAIVNFPKMSNFINWVGAVKTDGVFDLKETMKKYRMPGETEGASYGAYYTQLTFSDGTVKTVAPSAALVSNNFMQKWGPRQPYYIVAGPNYGTLTYPGLVGPDYNFGRSDLDVLEPMGVNAIIYVPRLGTYISSNQTAKQIPVSGLSKIHIRELVIYLQNEIEHLLQSYQWELNTQPLRDTIKAKADAICDTIKNNGGIYEFVNVCDETNNTPEVIDNEMIILDTEIEPARGAGKMVHQLTIHKTGGLTSSVK